MTTVSRNVYVNPISGSDSNDGSIASPVMSFDKAMDIAYAEFSISVYMDKYRMIDKKYGLGAYVPGGNSYQVTIHIDGGMCLISNGYILDKRLANYGATMYPQDIISIRCKNCGGIELFNSNFTVDDFMFLVLCSSYKQSANTPQYTLTSVACFELEDATVINSTGVACGLVHVQHYVDTDYPTMAAPSDVNGPIRVVVKNSSLTNFAESAAIILDVGKLVHVGAITPFVELANVSAGSPSISGSYVSTLAVSPAIVPEISITNSAFGSDVEYRNGVVRATTAKLRSGSGAFLPNTKYQSYAVDFVSDGWINDSTYSGGVSAITTSYINIQSGGSCRALSPVQEFQSAMSFDVKYVDALEVTDSPGSNQVADSTPLTTTRTIEYRSSETTAFGQTDASPEWVVIDRDGLDIIYAKYLQFRITLITNGA